MSVFGIFYFQHNLNHIWNLTNISPILFCLSKLNKNWQFRGSTFGRAWQRHSLEMAHEPARMIVDLRGLRQKSLQGLEKNQICNRNFWRPKYNWDRILELWKQSLHPVCPLSFLKIIIWLTSAYCRTTWGSAVLRKRRAVIPEAKQLFRQECFERTLALVLWTAMRLINTDNIQTCLIEIRRLSQSDEDNTLASFFFSSFCRIKQTSCNANLVNCVK